MRFDVANFLAPLVLVVVFTACAHQPKTLVSAGGRLDVANDLDEPVELFVFGGREALIEPGSTVFLDRLPKRTVNCLAVGVISGAEWTRTFDLTGSNPVRWGLKLNDQAASPGMAKNIGAVIIDNRSEEPVRPFINGKTLDLVFPGIRTAFKGIPIGKVQIVTVGAQTESKFSTNMELTPGVTLVVTVEKPGSGVRVKNSSNIKVKANIKIADETSIRFLEPGDEYLLQKLAPGTTVSIIAEDTVGRIFWSGSIVPENGKVSEVLIPSPSGSLSVLSEFNQTINILANGNLLGTCPALGATEFVGLVPGVSKLQAASQDGSVLARGLVKISTDETAVWFIRPGSTRESGLEEGMVTIINQTDETVLVRIDGSERGRIEAGKRRQFGGLIPGSHSLSGAGLVSGTLFNSVIEVSTNAALEWKITPNNSILAISNTRDEAVRILIDGKEFAEIAAGDNAELQVPAGERQFVAAGVFSMTQLAKRLNLPAATTTSLVLSSPFATVKVLNTQVSTVEIYSDQGILGVVEGGQSALYDNVTPGPLRLVARSIDRPIQWTVLVNLDAGDVYNWNIGMQSK